MINGTSFTGRETMLTKGLKSVGEEVAVKAHEYLGAGKIFDNAEAEKTISKAIVYKSPFEPINVGTESVASMAKNMVSEPNPSAISYAISHGTPEAHVGRNINYLG